MAHNLSTTSTGRIMMAYQGAAPWHKLGQTLPADATIAQAITAAHLDWTVRTEPVFLANGKRIPDKVATIREDADRYLSTVGDGYTVIQNADAFGTLADACEQHGITIATAGAIDDGRKVWMLARMNKTVTVTDGDDVNGYFLIQTGHDGMTGLTGRCTPIRVVCQNTLTLAIQGSSAAMVSIRHTASAADRVKEAGRVITAMTKHLEETGETFRALAAKRMTRQQIADYIDTVIPGRGQASDSDTNKQRRRDIAALVWCGKGADMAGADADGSTAWGAYNAVTEYFDHVRPAQSPTANGRAQANQSAVFGGNFATKAKALTAVRQLVAV